MPFWHDTFLFVVDVTTGERRQLTSHTKENYGARFSPDGRTIAYHFHSHGKHRDLPAPPGRKARNAGHGRSGPGHVPGLVPGRPAVDLHLESSRRPTQTLHREQRRWRRASCSISRSAEVSVMPARQSLVAGRQADRLPRHRRRDHVAVDHRSGRRWRKAGHPERGLVRLVPRQPARESTRADMEATPKWSPSTWKPERSGRCSWGR